MPRKITLKSPKWHWLILSPIGANDYNEYNDDNKDDDGNEDEDEMKIKIKMTMKMMAMKNI